MSPEYLAGSCGIDNKEAMFRRFTDTCGAYEIGSRLDASAKLMPHLLKVIIKVMKAHHSIDMEYDFIYSCKSPLVHLDYSDIKF